MFWLRDSSSSVSFAFVLLSSILFCCQPSAQDSSADPTGDVTGCKTKASDGTGFCFRSCSKNSKSWCFTAPKNCATQKDDCAKQTKCKNIECGSMDVSRGCVRTCPTVESGGPLGHTKCREVPAPVHGRCLIFCGKQATTGKFCYSGDTRCSIYLKNEATRCEANRKCGNIPCGSDDFDKTDCVQNCP